MRKIDMSENLEYQETIRAIRDKIVSDIYKLKGTNIFILEFYAIKEGRKIFITRKEKIEEKGYNYDAIKNEIKEKLFLEAYNKLHFQGESDNITISM